MLTKHSLLFTSTHRMPGGSDTEELQARLRAATLANARLQAQLERAERAAQAAGLPAPDAAALQDAERKLRQAKYELIHLQRECAAVEKRLNTEVDALRGMVQGMHAAKAATWRRARALRCAVNTQTTDLHQLLASLSTVLGAAGCYPSPVQALLLQLVSRVQDLEGAVSAFDEDDGATATRGGGDEESGGDEGEEGTEQRQGVDGAATRAGGRVSLGDSLASSTASERAGEASGAVAGPAPVTHSGSHSHPRTEDAHMLALHVERLSGLVGDLTRENKLLSDALTGRAGELASLRAKVAALEADVRCGDGLSAALAAAAASSRRHEAAWLREATDAANLRAEVAALQDSLRRHAAAGVGGRAAGVAASISSPSSLTTASSTPTASSPRSRVTAGTTTPRSPPSTCVTPITPLSHASATPRGTHTGVTPPASAAVVAVKASRTASAASSRKGSVASGGGGSSSRASGAASKSGSTAGPVKATTSATPSIQSSLAASTSTVASAGTSASGAAPAPALPLPAAAIPAQTTAAAAAAGALPAAARAALLAFAQQAVAGAYDSDAEVVNPDHWVPHAGGASAVAAAAKAVVAAPPPVSLRQAAADRALGALRQGLRRSSTGDASTVTGCSSLFEAEEGGPRRTGGGGALNLSNGSGDTTRVSVGGRDEEGGALDPLLHVYAKGGDSSRQVAPGRGVRGGGVEADLSWSTASSSSGSGAGCDTTADSGHGPSSGVAHMQVRGLSSASVSASAPAPAAGETHPSPRRRRDVTLLGSGSHAPRASPPSSSSSHPQQPPRRRASMEAIHADLRAIDAELGAMQASLGKAAAALGTSKGHQ